MKIPSPEKEESIFEGKSIEIKVEEALIMTDDFYNVAVSSPLPGVILLEGMVRTEKDKARAETIAGSIRGVVVVTNRLAVTGR